MLDRTRGDCTAPPLARGIFEPAPAAAAAAVEVPAARCAPSLAMMRERDMRGFRAAASRPVFVDADGETDGRCSGLWTAPPPRTIVAGTVVVVVAVVVVMVVAVARVVAAAVRDVGLTGGKMTACLGDGSTSGVLNILPGGEPAFVPPRRGLFVIASRTTLRGDVLVRCATMVPVLDLVEAALAPVAPRIFARELAVGANSLDVVPLGLKMEALSSSSLPLPLLFLLLLLLLAAAAVFAVPLLIARTLWRELVDLAGARLGIFAFVLLDRLGGRELDAPPFAALPDMDPMRAEAVLFLPGSASDGRAGTREGFLGGASLVSFGSAAPVAAVLDFDPAVGAVLVREAFDGEPTPKFHTLRTIDLAEDRNPKRGVALPLSAWVSDPLVVALLPSARREKRTAHGLWPSETRPGMPAAPSLLLPHFEHLARGRSFSLGLFFLGLGLLG